jgi:hypothetical protein
MSTKICPKCSNSHVKSGIFCSHSCANSRGPRTDDFKKKVSERLTGRIGHTRNKELLPRINTTCCGCNKPLRILESEFRINKTCGAKECISVACSINGRKSASKKIVRSKDEICLHQMCLEQYEKVDHNYIIADGWDADIVIHEHKVAILWNGPWHYKQMPHKNHSLKQVQTRDNIKIKLFESLGWKVMIFEDREFTPNSAFSLLSDLLK